MGIYIPGMEFPKSCPCELVGIGYDLYCSFTGGNPSRVEEYCECCNNGSRPDWCPLVEVQPHGRSIDADALFKAMFQCQDGSIIGDKDIDGWPHEATYAEIKRFIRHAPTIIPADPKGGADG